jgi:hypothetical protein
LYGAHEIVPEQGAGSIHPIAHAEPLGEREVVGERVAVADQPQAQVGQVSGEP